MYQTVGICSLCGGQVMGFRGAWLSVSPPPPDRCSSCGAVSNWSQPVIPMHPCRQPCSKCGCVGPHYCKGDSGQADGWYDTVTTFTLPPTPTITTAMVEKALRDADADPREGQTFADQMAESLNKQLNR